jgi:prevent-host-death family protein
VSSQFLQVTVQEAKTRLSELLARAERGDDIVIARAGVPVVRLQLVDNKPRRSFGVMRLEIPDDFDAPLAADELARWE